jgi:WD40 repeat protein
VKVWDLGTGIESRTLGGHPNNVVAVKYSSVHRLLFSVSAAYVKVWDVRSSNSCIKTLFSSGQAQSGPLTLTTPSRTLQVPVGETTINDLALGLEDRELYTASSDKVRIWELRKLAYVGKLSTPHAAAVMCLGVSEDGRVITGSKDHLISLVEPNMSGQSLSLSPPHYDGVQCLATSGNALFSGKTLQTPHPPCPAPPPHQSPRIARSGRVTVGWVRTGSRDMCIKRWDLSRMELVQSLNNAHKDWILGLCLINSGSVMISGCRGGILRVWAVPSFGDQTGECALLGEVRAHTSAINATVTNQQHIFTASK